MRICKECDNCYKPGLASPLAFIPTSTSSEWRCLASKVEGSQSPVTGKFDYRPCEVVNTDGNCDKWQPISKPKAPPRCMDTGLSITQDIGCSRFKAWLKRHISHQKKVRRFGEAMPESEALSEATNQRLKYIRNLPPPTDPNIPRPS